MIRAEASILARLPTDARHLSRWMHHPSHRFPVFLLLFPSKSPLPESCCLISRELRGTSPLFLVAPEEAEVNRRAGQVGKTCYCHHHHVTLFPNAARGSGRGREGETSPLLSETDSFPRSQTSFSAKRFSNFDVNVNSATRQPSTSFDETQRHFRKNVKSFYRVIVVSW